MLTHNPFELIIAVIVIFALCAMVRLLWDAAIATLRLGKKPLKAFDWVLLRLGAVTIALFKHVIACLKVVKSNLPKSKLVATQSPAYCGLIFADMQGRKFVIKKGTIVREDGKTIPLGKDPEAQINKLLRSGTPSLFQTASVLMREFFIPEFKVPVVAGMGATRLKRVERPAELLSPMQPARIAGSKVSRLPWDRTIYVPAEKVIHLPHDPS